MQAGSTRVSLSFVVDRLKSSLILGLKRGGGPLGMSDESAGEAGGVSSKPLGLTTGIIGVLASSKGSSSGKNNGDKGLGR